jgi:hypothetical protein
MKAFRMLSLAALAGGALLALPRTQAAGSAQSPRLVVYKSPT